MPPAQLYMLLLGSTPAGRNTEQHDIYFGIGNSLADLLAGMREFWPGAGPSLHIDAWRTITVVNDHSIRVVPAKGKVQPEKWTRERLFFLNLGGYKLNEFEEFHYKMLIVAASLDAAKAKAKTSAFFKHTRVPDNDSNKMAESHIDDKYGVDVDDAFEVKDILSTKWKTQFSIEIEPATDRPDDPLHLGYLPLSKIKTN